MGESRGSSPDQTMPKKEYIVALSPEERETLETLTTTGKAAAYKLNHARILLKADINQDEGVKWIQMTGQLERVF